MFSFSNKIEEQIFKNKKLQSDKLLDYGFVVRDGKYCLEKRIFDDQFCLKMQISQDTMSSNLVEIETGEPYTLFLVEGAQGAFVGEVRAEYEKVLREIAQNCAEDFVFKSKQANQIITYISKKYGDKLEFLWEKFPNNAIWRRKDNKKWYAALLTVSKEKLGLNSNELVEIIDLRMTLEDIERKVDKKKIFYGYHMNKKSWITIILDESCPLEYICELIDESYGLAGKK